MTFFRKIAASVACVAVICGTAVTLRIFEVKANGRKLAEDARVTRISAEQGDAKAESKLGTMYYRGEGVPQDYAEALRWYNKAADQGDAKAQYGIGYMYYEGQGMPQDYAEALRWYRRAADRGDVHAQQAIGSVYYFGRGLPQDRTEAARWYRLAADKGMGKAQYDLGYMYYYGQGISQDRTEAERWYQKAADQGDESAQRALGLRGKGLSTLGKVGLSVMFLGCLWVVKGYLLPGQNPRYPQVRALARMSLFCLTYVGLSLYGAFGVFRAVSVANTFAFAKSFVIGIALVLFISAVWPKITKTVLGISGILVVGVNLLMIARYDLWRRIAMNHGFYSTEGLLLGISISLAIVLWLVYKKSKGVSSPDLITEP
jgi:hypothetical protein